MTKTDFGLSCLGPFGFVASKNRLNYLGFQSFDYERHLMKVIIPDEDYSRMRELNLISMFLFHQVFVSFTKVKAK